MPVEDSVSDHKAIYVSIRILIKLSHCYYREVWNYKNADYNLLNNLIEEYDWNSLFKDSISVDDACEIFTKTFLDFCKICIPSKKAMVHFRN